MYSYVFTDRQYHRRYIYIHRTPQHTHSDNGIDDEVHWCVCVYCVCKYMQMVKYKTMYICVCQYVCKINVNGDCNYYVNS
jgi:hypothetical protein